MSKKKKILLLAGLIVFVYAIFSLGKSSNVIGFLNRNTSVRPPTEEEIATLDKNFPLPAEEENRWDVLIFGIGGANHIDGGLLTDSIMLFSLDKETKLTSLISIPRDIYVDLPGMATGKINEIYEKGIARQKETDFPKEAFSRLTGVHVDNVIVFDFKAFQEIVDALGGVDITLKKPFEEKGQWGYSFSLPEGPNHLNGQDALYFVRSRYSTSDFDRSLRQQQILLAIRDKAFSGGVLSNPLKLGSILKSLNKNIVTDLNIFDTGNIIKLANSFDAQKKQPILGHLSTDNLLYQTYKNDIYILQPQNDDWEIFRVYFKNIFD
ncbi:MAG: LCP family protein [bacterium]|nr:LCP family protein [bacterium]